MTTVIFLTCLVCTFAVTCVVSEMGTHHDEVYIEPQVDVCVIDGVTYTEGYVRFENMCAVCDPRADANAWSSRKDVFEADLNKVLTSAVYLSTGCVSKKAYETIRRSPNRQWFFEAAKSEQQAQWYCDEHMRVQPTEYTMGVLEDKNLLHPDGHMCEGVTEENQCTVGVCDSSLGVYCDKRVPVQMGVHCGNPANDHALILRAGNDNIVERISGQDYETWKRRIYTTDRLVSVARDMECLKDSLFDTRTPFLTNLKRVMEEYGVPYPLSPNVDNAFVEQVAQAVLDQSLLIGGCASSMSNHVCDGSGTCVRQIQRGVPENTLCFDARDLRDMPSWHCNKLGNCEPYSLPSDA